jgi:hypothetical protein
VVNSVGGKAALLKLALDWASAGDDEPVPVADRATVKAIQAESGPRQPLALRMRMVAEIAGRVAPLDSVLAAATDSDPDAADMAAGAAHFAGGRTTARSG